MGGAKKDADKYEVSNTLFHQYSDITDKTPGLFNKNWANQLGTLGSGNHFIELCLDENQDVWVMLHSGSRGVGNLIGRYFIEKAKRQAEQFFIELPDKDLAYLPEDTELFDDYVAAVGWAQNYALENRKLMMEKVLAALTRHIPTPFTVTQEAINCHHNYVEKENHFGRNMWVTRKGAIRAREGDLGIIPGSMGQRSYIVRGKGNAESYCSCSHGAGRSMSRTKARATFTVADLIEQTQGVECRKDDAVLDEIPSAYKNIDEVMANQTDLVEVVHTLKQVLCIKGN
jgi:tRNA-splicing ligase RtcB